MPDHLHITEAAANRQETGNDAWSAYAVHELRRYP